MDGGGVGVVAPPALEKNAAELTVMDVYDIASAVGQEFERVIDQHGCEAIARLMPKVVRVLEILEVLVSRNHINPELEELRLELDRLRLERMDRIEKERKHQKVRGDTGGYGPRRPGGELGPLESQEEAGRAPWGCCCTTAGDLGVWLSSGCFNSLLEVPCLLPVPQPFPSRRLSFPVCFPPSPPLSWLCRFLLGQEKSVPAIPLCLQSSSGLPGTLIG